MSALLQPTRIRAVPIGGAQVRVSVRGEGRPLLLVIGIGASLDLWGPFEEAMVLRGYQVIAFDLPGAGATPPVFPPQRMRGLARIAVGVLEALEVDRADVLGVSFGGIVAQEIARQAPDRVRRLVLAATGPGLGGPPGRISALIHLTTPLRYWSPAYAERIAGTIYGGRARLGPEAHAGLAARFERPPSWYGYFGQMYAITGWTSVPWLWRLRVPTLVLAGDDDPIVRPLNGRILAALIPGARLRVIPGGGHLFLLDETDLAVELVDDFLGD